MKELFVRISKETVVKQMSKMIICRLPRSAMIHNVMKMYIDDRYSNHIDTRFFAFKGITHSLDKSFIVATQHRSFFGDIAITTSEPADPGLITPEMLHGFESLLDWETKLAFKSSFDSKILREWCCSRGEIFMKDTCFAYYMNIKDALALKPRPVDGYKIGMLKPEHGIQISNVWPFAVKPGTAANMIDSIECLGGIGIYQSNALRCWILNSTNGQLFAFHVNDKYRKRGLGEWALTAMAKIAAREGLFPNALVVQANVSSQRLFEKVGFQKAEHKIEEIRYQPRIQTK